MRKTILISAALLFVVSACDEIVPVPQDPPSFGVKTAQMWECFEQQDAKGGEPIFRVSVNARGNAGRVEVIPIGHTHQTWFQIEGADRRWDWGRLPGEPAAAEYAFVIDRKNMGYMLDFKDADEDGRATTEETFHCKEVEVE